MKKLVYLFAMVMLVSGCAMMNTQIVNAFQNGSIHIGMTKQELINVIGYPPEGKSSPDIFYSSSVQTKVTNEGTEELWRYDYGIAPDLSGLRCVTFKIINNKVKEWYDWVDHSR